MNQKQILIAAGAVVLLLIAPGIIRAATVTTFADAIAAAGDLIPRFEGFRSTPYWDASRWSWGYGTAAPGPTGTITPEQGMADLQQHAANDYDSLNPRIKRPLSINQWAALLSFSYQEGTGNPGAGALITEINSGNDATLEGHWKQYVYANGVVDPNIVARRNAEWQLWVS